MPQVTLNGDVKQTLHQNLLQLLNGMNIEVVQAVGGG